MTNLREMQRRHPLGCAEFGEEWLRRWEAVGRLLDMPARVQCFDYANNDKRYTVISVINAVSNLLSLACAENKRSGDRTQIVLLDGTIIREWGPR